MLKKKNAEISKKVPIKKCINVLLAEEKLDRKFFTIGAKITIAAKTRPLL